MKKIFLARALATACVMLGATAQAGSIGKSIAVTVTLAPKCTIATIADLAFPPYLAFQSGGTSTSTPVVVNCTRGLGAGLTAEFDTNLPLASGDPASATPIGAGVVNGLLYQLFATSAPTSAGSAPTAPSTLGSPQVRTFTINGLMAGGQAGQVNIPVSPQVRTFTVNY